MNYSRLQLQVLMILFWKLHNIAQTRHIWFTTPKRVNGTTLSQMWKFFSLLIALSTWMQRQAIVWVRATSSGLICPLFPKKGGIFRETPRGRRSSIVNPLSAITESPLSNGKFRNPERVTISLSEMWPVYNWLTKVMAPPGEIPIKPFSVVWFLYELKVHCSGEDSLASDTESQYSRWLPLLRDTLL